MPVLVIGSSAFNHCKLTKVILSDGLKRINYGAFSNNSFFNITTPQSVEYIGEYAFYMEDQEVEATILNPNAEVDICAFYSLEHQYAEEDEAEFYNQLDEESKLKLTGSAD